MPSPKPVRTAALGLSTVPFPSAGSSSTNSPVADAGTGDLINPSPIAGSTSSSGTSGRPRRRSSLLKSKHNNGGIGVGTAGRPRKASTAASTATAIGTTGAGTPKASTARAHQLQPRDDPGDGWDDAWGEEEDEDGKAHEDGEDATQNGRNADHTLLDEDYGRDDGDLHTDEETGLGAAARRQRGDARRSRTNLDERFVPGGGVGGSEFGFGDGRLVVEDAQSSLIMAALTDDERKEADKNVLRRLLVNGLLIGLWYLFSLSISLYNKWMFGSNFPFPLFTTSVHMLVQFFLSCLVLYFVPTLRPSHGRDNGSGHRPVARDEDADEEDNDADGDVDVDVGNVDGQDAYKEANGKGDRQLEPAMTKWFYLTRIGPCGAATGLDIGLGNASLKLITLTFYTMCKSSSLAFVLLFAFAFGLEKPTLRLVAIIATMTVGVVMMVAGEVKFDPFGFFLVITAAFFSGFRWGLTQIMLLRNPATSNPFSSIFYLAPVMFVTLFALAIPMEGVPELLQGLRELSDKFGGLRAPLLVLFPGTIAFLMTASEFALLQRTSVVTLSIAGIFKEVVTIVTATLVFHDRLTLVNFLGLVVTLAAIVVYNYIKITKMRQQAQIDVHKEHSAARQHPMQTFSGPTEYGPGLGPSSSPSGSRIGRNAHANRPPPHDGDHDSDPDGENDAEDAGLLRK
ncbi:solute carrier family 35, member C2 [Sporothrix schenckii 1099-18]|uniref:Solute carrier family 35, member C2 n=1 Tax=Sporothrix schenckii 1099-18 TaxID=1397361 RepID=A0A0F2MD39_SPOSC|nr:solute carrier family 35, member C2 [Sporothrix schenckii 1099-18]KJR86770.1 solute carrier family 35, member C2 [Sporothrix schenckii 1099-18]